MDPAQAYRIAARHLEAVRKRRHLNPRGRDDADFLQVHVRTLTAMLAEAYEEGQQDARRASRFGWGPGDFTVTPPKRG